MGKWAETSTTRIKPRFFTAHLLKNKWAMPGQNSKNINNFCKNPLFRWARPLFMSDKWASFFLVQSLFYTVNYAPNTTYQKQYWAKYQAQKRHNNGHFFCLLYMLFVVYVEDKQASHKPQDHKYNPLHLYLLKK